MATPTKQMITIEATVNASIEKVWTMWNTPEHITQWNNASDDWHSPYSENDLRVGGKFLARMSARDGSASFDFSGIYNEVETHKKISYTMEDGRTVVITFTVTGSSVKIVEIFEAETENTPEQQKNGWQSILDNFKKYVETTE